jgi:putative membrane protein
MKKSNQQIFATALVAGLCLASTQLRAQNDANPAAEPAGAQTQSDNKMDDKKFVMEAAQGGMAEVKIGELASQKGQSSSVKQFGERLVKDHQQANDKLKQIAQDKGISVPSDLGKHQEDVDHLSKLSGEEFDKAFIQHAVKDHKKDIKKFEKEASEGEDPAIRSFASETVPTLREHLRIAQTLSENRNASIPALNEPAGAQPGQSQDQQQQQQQLPPDQNNQQNQQK